jgi:hypothetical protein
MVVFDTIIQILLIYSNKEIEIIIKDINIEICNPVEKRLPLSIHQNNVVILCKYTEELYLQLTEMSNFFNDISTFKNEKDLSIIKNDIMLVCHQPIIENLKIRYDQFIEINIISGFIEKKNSELLVRNIKINRILQNIKENDNHQ